MFPEYESEKIFSDLLLVIITSLGFNEYQPEFTLGLSLKLITSPSFPVKFELSEEYDITLRVVELTMLAE